MGYRVTTLNVNTIEPAGSTLTIGASGDTVVATDSVNVNTVKDAGGNTLWVSNGSGTLSSVNSGFGDALKLISSQTASASASISFTSGIDSTYNEYIFKFFEIHPATDNVHFQFQANVDGGSGYDETITSTAFEAYHNETNTTADVTYQSNRDQAQGTAYQDLLPFIGNDNDQCADGELHLFNPSSTTNIKNFFHRGVVYGESDFAQDDYIAGYFNVTAAITQIQFKMSSGNIDAGIIQMYGVL